MSSQLLRTKSIDKLIAEAETPEHRLRKSLGPWSLTALGIGAIIGSGIFVLTGTAAAGEYFAAPNFVHAQVLDLIINFLHHGGTANVLMHGRPPAGPAIAVSFILVAVACTFAGLCYAELASMIPIAGSAYTYSYACLGEIFAWIIGWDLILEYAVSNVAVAVGFSGYLKAQLASLGMLLPDKWSSSVWAGGHLTGAYFNVPALLVVMVLTVLLVRGVRESAEANNIIERLIDAGRRAEQILGQRLRSNVVLSGPVIHGASSPEKEPGRAIGAAAIPSVQSPTRA